MLQLYLCFYRRTYYNLSVYIRVTLDLMALLKVPMGPRFCPRVFGYILYFFDVHMFAFVTSEFETWISWGEFKA